MCYNQEFNGNPKVSTSKKEDGLYCRMCTTCGDVFNDGFIYNGGSMYFCSEECLGEEIKISDWDEAHEQYPDDNYYTEWDEKTDAEYMVKNGLIYLLETFEQIVFNEQGQPTNGTEAHLLKQIKEEEPPQYNRTIKAAINFLSDQQKRIFKAKVDVHNRLMQDGLCFDLFENNLTVVSTKIGLSAEEQVRLLTDFIENKSIIYSLKVN